MNNSFRAVLAAALILMVPPVWAHVVVSPSQAGIGSWVTFSVSVPNEKDTTNTQLKVLLPPGLKSVSPTVKPGWEITVKKDAAGTPQAIVWSNGGIPAEFRDDFTFSAQVPADPVELAWKAYQTYADGQVVAWDGDPADPSSHDAEALEKTGKGPFSVTKVIDDLSSGRAMTRVAAQGGPASDSLSSTIALAVSITALIVGVAALVRRPKANSGTSKETKL